MKEAEYRQFFRKIRNRDDVRLLSEQHPSVGYSTMISIYCQKAQEYTKKTLHTHRQEHVMAEYYTRYMEGETIGAVSDSISLSPCLLARIILEVHFKIADGGASPQKVYTQQVSLGIKDPSSIADARLRAEVENCIQVDDLYSPLMDRLRHFTGLEYEYVLRGKLDSLNVPFSAEDELRKQGFAKTPDIRLSVPILIGGRHIAFWIESKAMFGDPVSLRRAHTSQFLGYRNRYGPGAVIYWFGFVEETAATFDDGIIVLDKFPVDVVTLDDMSLPEIAQPTTSVSTTTTTTTTTTTASTVSSTTATATATAAAAASTTTSSRVANSDATSVATPSTTAL